MRVVAIALLFSCGSRASPSDASRVGVSVSVGVSDAAPRVASPPADAGPPGADFIADARLLYRIAACAGDAPVPLPLQPVVDRHCASITPYLDKYRASYFGTARAWFVAREPKDLPRTAIYPFGGGDLISALVPFPDATEITTISLELAGDPRHVAELAPDELDKYLAEFRTQLGLLVANGSNSSINLSQAQRNRIPAQLASHLLGLSAAGAELVAVRYFTLDETGAIHYLERSEIDADTERGKSLRGNWKSPAFSQSFANVEVQYRTPGDPAIRVHRHIAWNLGNPYLKDHPELLRHLEAKGKVAVLVKGASYLLWLADFSTFRGYLVDHLAWMISDSTGIPPTYAHGMLQDTYGSFHGPIIEKVEDRPEDTAMRELWTKHRHRTMPFRFGYLDKEGEPHLLITHPH